MIDSNNEPSLDPVTWEIISCQEFEYPATAPNHWIASFDVVSGHQFTCGRYPHQLDDASHISSLTINDLMATFKHGL